MNYQNIHYAVEGGLARLTLNRPDRLNSFTVAMHHEVHAALDAAAADTQVRTPMLLQCDAQDEQAYMEERFGPISFVVRAADAQAAMALSERIVRDHGALTAGIYSTRPEVVDAMVQATWRTKVALSINLTGSIFVNQSAAFSDYHGTGGNPSANASYADAAFVANRFRVVQRRFHL